MPGYMGILSKHEWDNFEKILLNRFKEFRQFYWLTKSLSDKIDNLSYIDDERCFIVDIEFSKKVNIDKTVKSLEDEMDNLEHPERYNINIIGHKDTIRIEIEELKKAGLP